MAKNEARSKPSAELLGKLYAALYPAGHPYAHSPFGTDGSLGAVSLADVCRFIDGYYVPSRAMLIAAGNVTADRMNAALARHLGSIPAREAAARRAIAPVLSSSGPVTVTVDADVEDTLVLATWPASRGHCDETDVLEQGMTMVARTIKRWDKFMGLVVEDVEPGLVGGVESPFAVFKLVVDNPSPVEWAQRSLSQALESRELAAAMTEKKLAFFRTAAAVRLLSGFEGLGERTARYGDWRQFRGPMEGIREELERFDRYTLAFIEGALSRRLDPAKVTWVIIRLRVRGRRWPKGRP